MPGGRIVGQEAWKAINQDVLLDPACWNRSEMSTANKNQIALLIINHFFPPKITLLPLPKPLNHWNASPGHVLSGRLPAYIHVSWRNGDLVRGKQPRRPQSTGSRCCIHGIREYPELEGTYKDHPTPGLQLHLLHLHLQPCGVLSRLVWNCSRTSFGEKTWFPNKLSFWVFHLNFPFPRQCWLKGSFLVIQMCFFFQSLHPVNLLTSVSLACSCCLASI